VQCAVGLIEESEEKSRVHSNQEKLKELQIKQKRDAIDTATTQFVQGGGFMTRPYGGRRAKKFRTRVLSRGKRKGKGSWENANSNADPPYLEAGVKAAKKISDTSFVGGNSWG